MSSWPGVVDGHAEVHLAVVVDDRSARSSPCARRASAPAGRASRPGRSTHLAAAPVDDAVDLDLGLAGAGVAHGADGSAARGHRVAQVTRPCRREQLLGRGGRRALDHLAHRRVLLARSPRARSSLSACTCSTAPPRSRCCRTGCRGSRARSADGRGARSRRRARRRRSGEASTGQVFTLSQRRVERRDEAPARDAQQRVGRDQRVRERAGRGRGRRGASVRFSTR